MHSVAMLSIKPEFSEQILVGTKTIELRKSSFGLRRGDIILVYESAPKQLLSFWFRVDFIEELATDDMWQRHKDELGINQDDYRSYFDGMETATGLHISDIQILEPPLPLSELCRVVPGFVPPQGLMWIRNNHGRFEALIKAISPPLPATSFPQASLFG